MKTTRNGLVCFALAGLLLTTGACEGDGPTDPGAPGVLELTLAARQAPADGATVLQVTGSVDPDTRGDGRKLTFTTSAGLFTDGAAKTATVYANESGVASVGLRAPTEPGVVRVRVTTGSIERVDSVLFTPAPAEQVLVELEKFAISAGIRNELRVTAQLRRGTGVPTAGTLVLFRAFRDGTQEDVGQFGVATLSDANGVVTVRYTAGNTTYRGPVRIVASTSGGAPVSGAAVLEITD